MFRRLYHISAATYSMKKQGIKLCKMLNPKSKQWYPGQKFDLDFLPSVKSLTKTKCEPGKRGVRRMAMLNKLFMKHITDLMSTGTVAMNIVGHGIEISKVQITPDFQTVNVFWVCKGNSTDDDTEALLSKTAGALRHELSTLRVMGEVPYIIFVKDKNESQLVDLDRCLAKADYGEEFVPTEIGHLLKSEFTLNTKLSPEIKAKIKQLEEEIPIDEDSIPEMTHTVYGLDHSKILNRILAARKKTRDAWNNIDNDSPVISYRVPESKLPEVNVDKQKNELAEFLLKRKILQNKLHKQMRDPQVDWVMNENDDFNDEEVCDDDDDDDDFYEDDEYYYEDDRLQLDRDKKNADSHTFS